MSEVVASSLSAVRACVGTLHKLHLAHLGQLGMLSPRSASPDRRQDGGCYVDYGKAPFAERDADVGNVSHVAREGRHLSLMMRLKIVPSYDLPFTFSLRYAYIRILGAPELKDWVLRHDGSHSRLRLAIRLSFRALDAWK